MKDIREEWYDARHKVSVVIADVTAAAQELARAHLSGPVSARYLAEALAAVAVLGAETSQEDETVSLQMKCTGPLGGVNVECTASGTLRGYAERKVLDDFDGMGGPDDAKVVGERRYMVTRSIPGKVLSRGFATSLDGYFADSLQRRMRLFTEVSVNDEVEVLAARAVTVEALPDSDYDIDEIPAVSACVCARTILSGLGLSRAELKRSLPMRFACRCSPERAAAMLDALSPEEIASLPPETDITCHMCGRTFTVRRPV